MYSYWLIFSRLRPWDLIKNYDRVMLLQQPALSSSEIFPFGTEAKRRLKKTHCFMLSINLNIWKTTRYHLSSNSSKNNCHCENFITLKLSQAKYIFRVLIASRKFLIFIKGFQFVCIALQKFNDDNLVRIKASHMWGGVRKRKFPVYYARPLCLHMQK